MKSVIGPVFSVRLNCPLLLKLYRKCSWLLRRACHDTLLEMLRIRFSSLARDPSRLYEPTRYWASVAIDPVTENQSRSGMIRPETVPELSKSPSALALGTRSGLAIRARSGTAASRSVSVFPDRLSHEVFSPPPLKLYEPSNRLLPVLVTMLVIKPPLADSADPLAVCRLTSSNMCASR